MRIFYFFLFFAHVIALVSCSSSQNQGKRVDSRSEAPTVAIWGFSCELGGNKCHDQKMGRKMQDIAIATIEKTRLYQIRQGPSENLNHLREVSDMIWSSGDGSLLPELESMIQSDFLLYGRVIAFQVESRELQVELTLVHLPSKTRYTAQGVGAKGSLASAVQNAMESIVMRPFQE